ncbi:MAG: hypothetical protein ABIV94_02695 [Acidimicrobiales bacterium]
MSDEEAKVSRRRLLQGGAAAAVITVGGGLAPGGILANLASAATPSRAPTSPFTLAAWLPLVGRRFAVVQANGASVPVTLREATALTPRSQTSKPITGESFSLVFIGSGTKSFASGTYTLTHPSLGPVALLLTPFGMAAGPARYEAIVNRYTVAL